MKVAITTLGCDKNTCESEALAGALKAAGYTLVPRDKDADIIIVNTCAFIKSARDEAVRIINSKFKYNAKVVVTGCITARHRHLIPSGAEVWDIGQIPDNHSNGITHAAHIQAQKLLSTPQSYVFIKISDGCNNHCSYCTIPSIRGPYKARPEADILNEAAHFASLGVGEFILVAQDLTKYPNLVSLIQKISKIPNVQRIRLHYVYPSGITQELVDEIARNEKICKYLDVPFQHASPRILKLMNRKPDNYLDLIRNLQSHGITIRSTFMVGFPTETDEDFEILCGFLKTARLNYVGFFSYSREEGTSAYSMPQVPEKVKRARLKTVQKLQSEVLVKFHNSLVGKTIKVVCDFCDPVLGYSVARSDAQSPEVDPAIIIKGNMKAGEYASARIIDIQEQNLIGELV